MARLEDTAVAMARILRKDMECILMKKNCNDGVLTCTSSELQARKKQLRKDQLRSELTSINTTSLYVWAIIVTAA